MDRKEGTKSDSKTPPVSTCPDQVAMDSDLALAMAVHEQEYNQNPEHLRSDHDEDNDDDEGSSVFSYDDEDFEFFDNREGFEELGAMEYEESESSCETDLDTEEDDIDPDEMSYEELLALGEIVGEASRGLTNELIASCFEDRVWCASESKGATDRCVVCQMEYEEGEKVVRLISCAHPYHSDCVTQWLKVKKTCPICNTEVSPSAGGAS